MFAVLLIAVMAQSPPALKQPEFMKVPVVIAHCDVLQAAITKDIARGWYMAPVFAYDSMFNLLTGHMKENPNIIKYLLVYIPVSMWQPCIEEQ